MFSHLDLWCSSLLLWELGMGDPRNKLIIYFFGKIDK